MITPEVDAPEIARELGVPKLLLKREDLHPYGSHKGRSIPVMIDMKVAEGHKEFAVSSSGNAALAALRHIQKRNSEGDDLKLSIFVGEHISPEKLQRLKDEAKDPRVTIDESPRPLQALKRLIDGGKASLRQSTDDEALVGYRALAAEIAATPDLKAVFVGSSSGTAAQAIAAYLTEHGKPAAVHVVQTSAVAPLARALGAEGAEAPSIADAIVDRVAHRREAVVEAVGRTGGKGWIAAIGDIRRAQALLRDKAGIDATGNGALGLAGLIAALAKGERFDGSIVCIVTGR